MTGYDVRSNHTNKIVKTFDTLEDAIQFCDSKKTEKGHRVTRTESDHLVTYYDTFEVSKKMWKGRNIATWGHR